jgi:hypothetical protein
LERLENDQVTFRYRDNRTQQTKHAQISAVEFIGRFLQHVLPKGLVKVRSYGLWSATNADKLNKARTLLALALLLGLALPSTPLATKLEASAPAAPLLICPRCKSGRLILVASLLPERIRGP